MSYIKGAILRRWAFPSLLEKLSFKECISINLASMTLTGDADLFNAAA